METLPNTQPIDNDLMQQVGITPRQIALLTSLPSPLKKEAFRQLLNLAAKREGDLPNVLCGSIRCAA